MGWRSVHVYYYDEAKDDLVVEAVRPLLHRVAADVPSAYFVRHWRRGPHLRLNFRADPPTHERAVRPAVAEIVGGYLARRPSTAVVDPQRLLPLHTALAEAEQDFGPRSPWLPDNSVHEAEYDHRQHVLGGPAAADLLADFYVTTNDIAFTMAEQVLRGGQRLSSCFDLMIATAHAYSGGGLPRGFVSFRSHAEAYLVGTPNAEQRRDSWQQRYAQHGARLRARVDDVIASLDGGTRDVPLVREWVSALQPLHRRSEELISAGALLADEPPPPPSDGAGAFHQALLLGPTYTAQIRESVWFRSYRMMLNYLYLQMTRHGVRPVDRFMLCHLAANAVEERLGVTAIDLVAGRATL